MNRSLAPRMPRHVASRFALPLAGALVFAAPLVAQTTAPYNQLTNTYDAVTNFNVETTRGMVLSSTSLLAAVNTHGSTFSAFFLSDPNANYTATTLNNPIAIDTFLEPGAATESELIVVLCAGTHALATHRRSNGAILDVLQLSAETGDLVVDEENGRCFVSIPGNNTCVQVSLPSLEIEAIFEIASKAPRFLSLDTGNPADPSDNRVYCAPELSGNNSLSRDAFSDGTAILGGAAGSFEPSTVAIDASSFVWNGVPVTSPGMPDRDLFLLPAQGAPTGMPPTITAEPMLRGAGTILNAHGRNPVTGAYWMVGTDSLNTAGANEPDIVGDFARNQLVIAGALGAASGAPYSALPQPSITIDLDDAGGYNAQHSVSMPFGLGFHPTGVGMIVGSASDRIRFALQNGTRFGDQDLPPGSIPRQVLSTPDGLAHVVYCWGTNELRVYDTGAVVGAIIGSSTGVASTSSVSALSFSLGVDPTPDRVARGRELFYDASHSADGRLTCAHCHPGGGMDLLGWSIADFPHDHKDLMVTQSLKGIEDTFPYHWRGENDLEAFNDSFMNLLGGTRLTTDTTDPGLVAQGLSTDTDGIEGNEPSEFEDFKAFIFSLQPHANHLQSDERILDASLTQPQWSFPASANPTGTPVSGDPVRGQLLMDKPETFQNRFSCADCHGLPNGSVGDPQADDPGLITGNNNMDVAHFRQLFQKVQEVEFMDISLLGLPTPIPVPIPRGGFGLSHDGNHTTLLDFILRNPFDLDSTTNEHGDIAAFLQQIDEGIAPAAHLVLEFDASTDPAVGAMVQNMLIPQTGQLFASSHWIDLAIMGTHKDASGAQRELRWFFDQAQSSFVPNDRNVVFPNGQVGLQGWNALMNDRTQGRNDFVLIGLPPGDGERWAVDRDDDGLDETDEIAIGSDPLNQDSDGDGDPDGHEVLNQGNPIDGNVTANDTTLPTVVSARIDHTGASYIKLALQFSEPVTYFVTAIGANSGATVERRMEFVTHDSVSVQRLTPSLPSITTDPSVTEPIPTVARVPNPHAFTVTMSDLAGNRSSVQLAVSAETRDQLVFLPFSPQTPNTSPIPAAALSRTIGQLRWSSGTGGASFQATAQVNTRFDTTEVAQAYMGPVTPNGSQSPWDQQVVAFSVVHTDAMGTRRVLSGTSSTPGIPSLTVSAGSLTPTILLGTPASSTPIGVDGPFLIAPGTGLAGTVNVGFNLSSPLQAGESLALNVIGIYERDSQLAPGGPQNLFLPSSLASYNKPATRTRNRSLSFP